MIKSFKIIYNMYFQLKLLINYFFLNRKAEWNEIADRNVFINSVTGECRWEMPDEVRFYLPPKMEDKVFFFYIYIFLI